MHQKTRGAFECTAHLGSGCSRAKPFSCTLALVSARKAQEGKEKFNRGKKGRPCFNEEDEEVPDYTKADLILLTVGLAPPSFV